MTTVNYITNYEQALKHIQINEEVTNENEEISPDLLYEGIEVTLSPEETNIKYDESYEISHLLPIINESQKN